ncbi:MAG: hypothetical protein IKU21_06635, partial [Anaerotignum sp.]|nr:hypothetical protein [Anaerotignum sp.]
LLDEFYNGEGLYDLDHECLFGNFEKLKSFFDKEYDLDGLYDLWVECEDDDMFITVEVTLDKNDNAKKIVGKIKDSDGKSEGDVDGLLTDIYYDEADEDGRIEVDDEKYDFDKDTSLEIDGKAAKWDDLVDLFDEAYEDDEDLQAILILDPDEDDYVTDVEIYTEDYEFNPSSSSGTTSEADGTISKVTLDADNKGTLKIGTNTYRAYDRDEVEISIIDGDGEITTWDELYNASQDKKVMTVELEVDDNEVLAIEGYVSTAKGYLSDFGDKYLKVKGKFSSHTEKYYFTDYDRSDDEKDDWMDDAESIDITGIRNVSTLYDFYYVWLDDSETNLRHDKFDLVLTLDKDGFITEIEGELE